MTKEKAPKTYDIYLTSSETIETIRDDFNRETWDGYYEQQIDFEPLYLTIKNPNSFNADLINIDFDPEKTDKTHLYAVIARYTDGGTFGCTHGYHEVVGIFETEEAAYECEKSIYDDMKAYRENKSSRWKHWRPWQGYFASLDSVGIHYLELRKE